MRRLRPTRSAIVLILVAVAAIPVGLRLWTSGVAAWVIPNLLAIPVPLLLLLVRRLVFGAEALPEGASERIAAHREFGLLGFYSTYMLLCVNVVNLLWPIDEFGILGIPVAARIALALLAVFMWLVLIYAFRGVLKADEDAERAGQER